MKKFYQVVLLIFLIRSITTSNGHHEGEISIFSDSLEVGDIFYWRLTIHQFEGEEPVGYQYKEGDIIRGVITGNLTEDVTNIDLYIEEEPVHGYPSATELWPILPTKVDYIILIFQSNIVHQNGTISSYFDHQVDIYGKSNSTDPLINYQNSTVENGEFIFQQSVRSNNFDFRTYEQNDRYDYETGVLNYHNHKEVDDDGSVFREVLFERISEEDATGGFDLPFESTLIISLHLILIGIFVKRSRINKLKN